MENLIFIILAICITTLLFYTYNRIISNGNGKEVQKNKYIGKLRKKINLTNLILFIAISIPIIICGFRYNVGTDYAAYIIRFEEVTIRSLKSGLGLSIEWGDILLCKIGWGISKNVRVIFLLYSIFTVIFAYKAILNNKINRTISLLMYLCIYWTFSMNGIRQALSMSIIMYSFKYIIDKDFKKYIVFQILATSFHASSIIFFPFAIVWMILKEKKGKEILIYLLYSLIPILIFASSKLFLTIQQFSKYSMYFENISFSDIGFGVLLQNLPVIIMILMFKKKMIENNYNNYFYITMYFVGIILQYMGYISLYLGRFAIYFNMVQIFLFPEFANLSKNKKDKLIINLVLIIYSLGYNLIYLCYIKGWYDIFPYTFRLF